MSKLFFSEVISSAKTVKSQMPPISELINNQASLHDCHCNTKSLQDSLIKLNLKFEELNKELSLCKQQMNELTKQIFQPVPSVRQQSSPNNNPQKTIENIILRFDGGASPNPGIGGSGCVLTLPKKQIELATFHPHTTNNEAEYNGLLLGLRYINTQLSSFINYTSTNLTIEGDSMLVVQHCLGSWKCNAENLKPFLAEAKCLMSKFKNCKINHIPRAENAKADELSNIVRDLKKDFIKEVSL